MGHDWQSFDWQGARYNQGDLIPGNPDQVATLGRKLRDAADTIDRQVANLRAMIDGNGFDSDSGRAFQEQIGDAADNLQKVHKRYDEAARALGTSVRAVDAKSDMSWGSGTEWASTLELAQMKAKEALNRGKTADAESSSAQRQIDTANAAAAHTPPPPPGSPPDPATTRLHNQKTQADGDLQNAGRDLQAAIDLRDREGRAVASAIKDVIEHDGLKDESGFWHDVAAVVAEIGHIAGALSAVFGVLALVCAFIPGLQALGALFGTLSLITGLVALGCDTISALDGNGTWLDVGIDLLGVASFGAGRVLGEGAKGAEVLAKAGKAEAILSDARALQSVGTEFSDAWGIASEFGGGMKMMDAFDAMKTAKNFSPAGIGDVLHGFQGVKQGASGLDMIGYLRGAAGSPFSMKAFAYGGGWAASQTVPLALGWGNLANSGGWGWDNGNALSPVTGQNWFDHAKTHSPVGMNGIPGVNWNWEPDGGWHAGALQGG
ncbi:MAG: WXG100 family type VII secretion target [Catenulispora sp.]